MSWVRRMNWSMRRDKEGHRDYTLTVMVKLDVVTDGPAAVLSLAGMPQVGDTWSYGTDYDIWAFCSPEVDIQQYGPKNEPGYYWTAQYKFSTRPMRRCQDESIEDPLQEPMQISGSFMRYTELTEKDKDDNPIQSSSHEGIQIERDRSRPTVSISQNVANLELETFSEMVDTLNDAELWGLAARKIKLSNVSWSRKLYGICDYYFTRTFEFEVRFEGWDYDDIVDKGRNCLRGSWAASEDDPPAYTWTQDADADADDLQDFILALDPNDNPQETLLDGSGGRLTDATSPVFITAPEVYGESNFLLLGIPTNLATGV